MILIGISGKKKSGKDTVYKIIESVSKNVRVSRIAFADSLKDEVALATGVKVSFIEEEKDNFRTILQWWGTDFKRKYYGDDYWIKKFLDKVTRSDSDMIIVTDVRFPNEADTIRQVGGIVVRVDRTFDIFDTHPSEMALDNYKFDYLIDNSTTLESLKQQTIKLMKYVQATKLSNTRSSY